MRRGTIRLLALVLAMSMAAALLAGCQREQTDGGDRLPVPVEGLYTCYSLSIQDLELGPARRWLRLLPGGQGTLCLSELQETGSWTLEGDAFRWTPDDGNDPEAVGLWSEGVLSLTIGEMQGIFVREGVIYPPAEDLNTPPGGAEEKPGDAGESEDAGQPAEAGEPEDPLPQPAPALPEPAVTTYSCYDGLYYIDYDPEVFHPGPAGGPDLVKDGGTSVWFARLATQELMETWLEGMEEKGQYREYQTYEVHEDEAAGFQTRSIVYQDESGWHAETVVDLETDRGTAALPMYAVYITCDGPGRQSVWTDGVKVLLATLRLGEPET